MFSFPITVLLAFGSALTRRAVSATLGRAEGVVVVGETDRLASLPRMVASLQPDLILCDEPISLATVLPATPYAKGGAKRPQLVLVTTNPNSVRVAPDSGIVLVLPLNLPAQEWGRRLASAIAAGTAPLPAPTARPVAGMEKRFMVVEQPEDAPPRSVTDALANATNGATTQPLFSSNWLVEEPVAPARTSRLERRSVPLTQFAWRKVTSGLSTEVRDATTGLSTVRVLDLAMLELPKLNLPAAVLMIGVHFLQQPQPNNAAAAPVLRLVGVLLRANVRQGDLVCFLDRLAFAVVMLGVDEDSILVPLQRIREALLDIGQLGNQLSAPRAALGTGFWKPGTPLEQPIRSAWQAMVRERSGRS